METLEKLDQLKNSLHRQIGEYSEEIAHYEKNASPRGVEILTYYRQVRDNKVSEYGNALRALKRYSQALDDALLSVEQAEKEVEQEVKKFDSMTIEINIASKNEYKKKMF